MARPEGLTEGLTIRFVIFTFPGGKKKVLDIQEMPWRLTANGSLPADIQRGFISIVEAQATEGMEGLYQLFPTPA